MFALLLVFMILGGFLLYLLRNLVEAEFGAELPRAPAPPLAPLRIENQAARRPQVVGARWTPRDVASSECQVCGGRLQENLVACPACATLHHDACWDYARGCSTYGCEAR